MIGPIRSATRPAHEHERARPSHGTVGAILVGILFVLGVPACGGEYSPTSPPTHDDPAAEAPSGRSDSGTVGGDSGGSDDGDDGTSTQGGTGGDSGAGSDGSTADGSGDSTESDGSGGDAEDDGRDSGGSDSGQDDSGGGDSGGGGSDESTDPSSGSYPNRPAGFSTLTETSYGAPDEGGFSSSTNGQFAIVDDPSAPESPSTVARATFPAGLGDGRSPIWSEASISSHSTRKLYLSFWVRISDNWQGHRSGVNKVAFAWIHGNPSVFANIHGRGSGALEAEMRIQGVPGKNRNLSPNRGAARIERGRWHQWEIVLVSNTGDSADGEVHWWLDGRKVGAYTDVRFGTSAQSEIWEYATWRPVWGGRGDEVQQTMHMWMDHYHVAGAR